SPSSGSRRLSRRLHPSSPDTARRYWWRARCFSSPLSSRSPDSEPPTARRLESDQHEPETSAAVSACSWALIGGLASRCGPRRLPPPHPPRNRNLPEQLA